MIAEGTTMGATTYSHKEHAIAIVPFHSSFFESLHKEQWKEVRLGEAPLQIIDGDRGKNYPKQKELFDNGYCLFLNTKNVLNAKFDFTECQFINKEKDESLRKGKMQINDIVLTTRGTIGNMALYRENINYKNIRINSGMVILRPDTMEVNSTFLLYAMLNSKKYIDNFVSGSAQPQLPIKDLSNLTISLPSLETQRKVAEILSSFDDKIDLLHRQNKTLESLALTLFRHTFIDNPNRNEWEESKIGDYVECVNGYSYKSSELDKSNIALVTLKNFARDGSFNLNGFKEFIGTKFKDSQIVKNGDLVVAHTDITQEAEIIGNPALIIDIGKYKKLIITMDLVKVEPKIEWISKEFLYYLFKTQDFKSHCLGNSNGTTVLHMNRKTILEYTTKIPNPKAIMEFTKNVSYFFGKTCNNLLQIQSLQSMRDMLLSKILNEKMEVLSGRICEEW